MRIVITALALAASLTAGTSAQAVSYLFGFTTTNTGVTLSLNGTASITAGQTGWFDDTGSRAPYTGFNYVVSTNRTPNFRNYLSFTNLTSGSAGSLINSATLNIAYPSNGLMLGAGVGSVTYTLFDVTTLVPTSAITATAFTGRTDIYADLGSGVSFGSVTVDSYAPVVSIALNQAGLDALNASGGNFIVGGALTENSTVPEPATWALLIAGFAMTGVALRRRIAANA